MSKITIVTKTYNREHLLPRTVKSVLSQTFRDFEYLLINNGSTDGTQILIDSYCKEDKRIRNIFYSFNSTASPVSAERKWWLDISTPYCMVIDDDDFMEPITAETLYNLITEYNADISCVGSKHVFPDGSMKDKFVFDGTYLFNRIEAMTEMLRRAKFNAASGGKLFRTCLLDIEFPNVKKIRDIHASYRRMNNIHRMVVHGKPLYYFYRHDGNISGLETQEQITPEKMRQHLDANRTRTEWLTEHMPEIKDFVFYCELSFMISLYERIYRLDVQPCFNIAQEMKEILFRHSAFLQGQNFCTEREKEILKTIFIDY